MAREFESHNEGLASFQQEMKEIKKNDPTSCDVDTTSLTEGDYVIWSRLKEIAKEINVSLLGNTDLVKEVLNKFKPFINENNVALKAKNDPIAKSFNAWINGKINAIYTNLELSTMVKETDETRRESLEAAITNAVMLEMNHPTGIKLLKRQLKTEQLNEEIKRVDIKALNPEKLELLSEFFNIIESIKSTLSREVVGEQEMIMLVRLVKKMDKFSRKIKTQDIAERCRDVVDMVRSQLVTLKGKLVLFLNPKAKPEMKQRMIAGIITNINRRE